MKNNKGFAISTMLYGLIFITVAMVLFAFTTLLGNLFYVDKALIHIVGTANFSKVKVPYYIVSSLLILLGAGLNAGLLWNIADITMGAMALINVPVILILSKYAFRALKDYEYKLKNKKEISFKASDIGLPHQVDYWR